MKFEANGESSEDLTPKKGRQKRKTLSKKMFKTKLQKLEKWLKTHITTDTEKRSKPVVLLQLGSSRFEGQKLKYLCVWCNLKVKTCASFQSCSS